MEKIEQACGSGRIGATTEDGPAQSWDLQADPPSNRLDRKGACRASYARTLRTRTLTPRVDTGESRVKISRSLRFQILRRDGHACRYCGATANDAKLTIDHVVPTALGGRTEPDNLVTACDPCNGGKSATPPDAAHVAQVADDALRWAAAMQQAAEQALANESERYQRHAEFEEAWRSWHQPSTRRDVLLPPEWRSTVDRLVAAGLPMPILLDCIEIAMTMKNVTNANVFRYMCGVAWNKVTKIQEAAKAIAQGPSSVTDRAASQLDRPSFADDILYVLDKQTADRALADIEAEGPWEGNERWPLPVSQAYVAVCLIRDDREAWVQTGGQLLAKLPGWLFDEAKRETEEDFIKAECGPDYPGDVVRHIVRHAGRILATCEITKPAAP